MRMVQAEEMAVVPKGMVPQAEAEDSSRRSWARESIGRLTAADSGAVRDCLHGVESDELFPEDTLTWLGCRILSHTVASPLEQ